MPTSTTAKSLLDSLSNVGGYVGLAVQLGETLIPIGQALVNKIKGNAAGTITETYQLLVAGDEATLGSVVSLADADLVAINAALAAAGQPPIPIPPTPTPPAGSGS